MKKRAIAITLAAATLGLAACGSDYTTANIPDGSDKVPAGLEVNVKPIVVPAALKDKPKVTLASGKVPSKLVVKNRIVGTGAVAKAGSTITVNYVGVLFKNGKEFDSSWKGGKPATFTLGQVIPGWNQGIPGMKVGGRRELVIPAKLAYGAQAQPTIPANSPLVFVVDLLAVN